MKLKNQVCTLEQGKRLKELGLKELGYFAYADLGEGDWLIVTRHLFFTKINYEQDGIPAYTSAELSELLPIRINGHEEYWISCSREDVDDGTIEYWNGYNYIYEGRRYEAHAKATVLIILLEKNIIALKDLKL